MVFATRYEISDYLKLVAYLKMKYVIAIMGGQPVDLSLIKRHAFQTLRIILFFYIGCHCKIYDSRYG